MSGTVKPLVWDEPGRLNNNCWVAKTIIGDYCVACEGGWWYAVMDEGFRHWEWEPEMDARSYTGPSAAQAACQADYEARILSAITLPQAGAYDGEAVVDGLHTADQIIIRDLTSLLLRLLKRHVPKDHKDHAQTLDYIRRKGLASPFRVATPPSSSTPVGEPDELAAELRDEARFLNGEAVAWGADTYADQPRVVTLLAKAESRIEQLTAELRALEGETFKASADAAEYHRDNAITMWDAERKAREAAERQLAEARTASDKITSACEAYGIDMHVHTYPSLVSAVRELRTALQATSIKTGHENG
jgi:hypothetical protein